MKNRSELKSSQNLFFSNFTKKMTYIFQEFEYYIDEQLHFCGILKVCKCFDINCNKIIDIGLPYCSFHMQQHKKIIIKQINDFKGKGVIAFDPNRNNESIIFYKNEIIINYHGDFLYENDINNRYREFTGPYAVNNLERTQSLQKEYIDCALHRHIGGMINCCNINEKANVQLKNIGENLYFVALNNIYNNTELIFDYGDEYKMYESNVRFCTKEITIENLINKYKLNNRSCTNFLNIVKNNNLIPDIKFCNLVYFNMNFKRKISINSFDKRNSSNISELSISSNNSSYNNILKLNDNEVSNKKKSIQTSIITFYPKINNTDNINNNNSSNNNDNNNYNNNNNCSNNNNTIKILRNTYEIKEIKINHTTVLNYINFNNKNIEVIDLINNYESH